MILKILRFPTQGLTSVLHKIKPHDRNISSLICGALLMALGSFLATEVKQHVLPHFLQDMFAYFLHGCGATPLIEAVFKKIE